MSAQLDAFLAESPLNRPHIADFVRRAAASVPAGADVLDVGAGAAPYRELFEGRGYRTADWGNSPHAQAQQSDVIASIDDLPFEDAAFDLVLCTEVLEHVAEPLDALREIHRILRPGGQVWLTAPFVWELHEEPFDFFRYSPHGLRHLMERAGFTAIDVEPFGGAFSTVGQILRNLGSTAGVGGPGRPLPARAAAVAVSRVGTALGRLDRLDRRRALPLGHGAHGRRPAN